MRKMASKILVVFAVTFILTGLCTTHNNLLSVAMNETSPIVDIE